MQAYKLKIIERLREDPFAIPHLSDFRLEDDGNISADEILRNESISLYSLEFETRQAVFVEIPAEIDLSQAPFMYVTQYDAAISVITLSFDDLLLLAEKVSVDKERLIFIHSTGRCGSTLASRIFAQVPGVINLSEPFFLPQIVIQKVAKSFPEDHLKALFKASIVLLCKSDAARAWVIKEHSYVIELIKWVGELFQEAKQLFLYRDAETWMRSCLSAYVGGGKKTTAEEIYEDEKEIREYIARFTPPLYKQANVPHFTFAELYGVMWLHTLTRHAEAYDLGMKMLAVRYTDWKKRPQKTAEAMLEYCDCLPIDLTPILSVLDQDSQAGTVLAQDVLKEKWELSNHDRATLARVLSEHPFINSADYVAPNSL